jgi:hypothetical protein
VRRGHGVQTESCGEEPAERMVHRSQRGRGLEQPRAPTVACPRAALKRRSPNRPPARPSGPYRRRLAGPLSRGAEWHGGCRLAELSPCGRCYPNAEGLESRCWMLLVTPGFSCRHQIAAFCKNRRPFARRRVARGRLEARTPLLFCDWSLRCTADRNKKLSISLLLPIHSATAAGAAVTYCRRCVMKLA